VASIPIRGNFDLPERVYAGCFADRVSFASVARFFVDVIVIISPPGFSIFFTSGNMLGLIFEVVPEIGKEKHLTASSLKRP